MDQEIWKLAPGFEELYEVSSLGRVRNRIDKHLKAFSVYPTVHLIKDGMRREAYVHKLVLTAFKGDAPEGKPICRHLDGNSLNMREENLEWGSHKQNSEDRTKHGRATGTFKAGAEHCHAKLSYTDVNYIRSVTGLTQKELAQLFHVNQGTISRILQNKTYIRQQSREETT